MIIEPKNGNVLIDDQPRQKEENGFLMPDDHKKGCRIAKVIAVDSEINYGYKPGDYVALSEATGHRIDGTEYRLISVETILAKIKDYDK